MRVWLLLAGVIGMGGLASRAMGGPAWIAPPEARMGDRQVTFTGSLAVGEGFDRALVRVAARDHYRLFLNGTGVSIGDTPWDAETYDVTRLLRRGANEVRVEVAADPEAVPENCWITLEHRLARPGSYERLRFRTADARHGEWVYAEVTDAGGNTSGFYCLEKGRSDLNLGESGAEQDHVIELRREPRLTYRTTGECDFSRIAAVRLRVDQKRTSAASSGTVRFGGVCLEGAETLDLSDAGRWRLVPGRGEHRRSRIEAVPGGLVLRYDFTPSSGIFLALDLRAWQKGREIAALQSGPALAVEGQASTAVIPERDTWAWFPLSLGGPEDALDPVATTSAALRFQGDVDRWQAGTPIPARVRAWSLAGEPAPRVLVEAEDWQGKRVYQAEAAVAWSGASGDGSLTAPGLPRGLYRFRVVLGQGAPERFTALAVLGPGEKRVSALFDTLTPVAPQPGLQGIDMDYQDSPALLLGIRDLGVNFLDVHLGPSQLDNGDYDDLLAFCKAARLRFTINNEAANWGPAAKAPDGRGRYEAAGGCHRWDLEPDALRKAAATGLFEGVTYDEGEHMQLCRNNYSNLPDKVHRKPYLVETTGMSLPQAYDAFLAAARKVNEYNRAYGEGSGSRGLMVVESVFPVLWHPLARAGVTLCPKLLKEDIHPVVLAHALGAAKEYGAEVWLTPDLWYLDRFPGHSVREYAAALRLAHLAGVDNVYSEHIRGFVRIRGALYDLTPYARALHEYLAEWRPAHPRSYTYRDYEPEVAIIRFPDSDWGQASCRYWNTLYGSEGLQSTPETREWLQVWHLLTGGASHPGAVNANSSVYPRGTWRFDIPSAPTAVYDHRVGDGPLAGVNTLFLCGVTLSQGTLDAVRRQVRAGATCFTPARFCPPDVRTAAAQLPAKVPDGKGAWIVVPGYRPEDLGTCADLVPKAGTAMRLRFKGQTVSVP